MSETSQRGRFVTIEGGEGAGKSTQARLLAGRLRAAGHEVVLTREPGGTTGAEALRGMLLSGDYGFSLQAEVLLHFAARADHVAQVIRPALARGAWVVSDRFYDSTMAYQGYGQGADRGQIATLSAMLGCDPDVTVVLDVPVEVSLARLAQRGDAADRYERLGAAFFGRVREGFLTVAREAVGRCVVVEGDREAELVAASVSNCLVFVETVNVSSTIEVFCLPISKNQLKSIPRDDRNFLLLASHSVNQILVLRKIVTFSSNYQSDNAIENTLSAAQSQMMIRFLVGSLAETWELIKRPTNQRLIAKDYVSDLEIEGKTAHSTLKKHFGRSGLLHKIRNTVSYHHPSGVELSDAFDAVADDEELAWYPSDTINNSYYLGSDIVISTRVLQLTGELDVLKAFTAVMEEVTLVSNELIDFLLYMMRAIVSRHLDANLLSPARGTGIEIKGVPNLYKVGLPFFTYRND